MRALLDCNREMMRSAPDDLPGLEIGQLLTPLTQRADCGLPYGIDNGSFSKFEAKTFRSLIRRQEEAGAMDRCLFVAAPDIVGNARRTLEVFGFWYEELCRWPVALVLQDGMENFDMPWSLIRAVFVGGTDDFKQGPEARDIVKAAKALGKYVHVGRVNTRQRLEYWDEIGADSFDGTGMSMYSHMREAITAPQLFDRTDK